jgi:hypothetical protein
MGTSLARWSLCGWDVRGILLYMEPGQLLFRKGFIARQAVILLASGLANRMPQFPLVRVGSRWQIPSRLTCSAAAFLTRLNPVNSLFGVPRRLPFVVERTRIPVPPATARLICILSLIRLYAMRSSRSMQYLASICNNGFYRLSARYLSK